MERQPPPEASTLQRVELGPPSRPKQQSSIRDLQPSQQTQFPRYPLELRRPPTLHPPEKNLPRCPVARCLPKQRKQLAQHEQQSSVTGLQLPRATPFPHKLLLYPLGASSPPSNLRHLQPPQAARFQHMALKPRGPSQELSSLWKLQPSLAARCRQKPRDRLKLLAPQSNLKHRQPPKAAQFPQRQLTRLKPPRQQRSSPSNLQSSRPQPARYPQKQLGLLGPPTPQLSLRGLQPPHVAQRPHRQRRHPRHHQDFSLRHPQSSQPPQVHQKPR